MSNGKKRNAADFFRQLLGHWFDLAEDTLYVGLGLLLVAIAFTLLITEIVYFAQYVSTGLWRKTSSSYSTEFSSSSYLSKFCIPSKSPFASIYFGQNPFWSSGLIAVTRRILVLTAEMSKLAKETQRAFTMR